MYESRAKAAFGESARRDIVQRTLDERSIDQRTFGIDDVSGQSAGEKRGEIRPGYENAACSNGECDVVDVDRRSADRGRRGIDKILLKSIGEGVDDGGLVPRRPIGGAKDDA